MLRFTAAALGISVLALAGCSSGYAVRPVPRIVADNVGKPVSALKEAFGEPRKVDSTPTKQIYVWFLPQKPKDGGASGFQGCEMEVTVDARSQRVLGYSLSNIGWSVCRDVERRIRVAGR
ncbi:MAG: hypothetical protein QOF42_3630 [Gammaproteobacteria bacterium]|jgi:hypothetical protein|nr:hypothetical protein [Gammaproteobacteria bacterium]